MSGLCPPLGLLSTLRLLVSEPRSGPRPEAAPTCTATALSAALLLRDVLQLMVVGAEPGDPRSLADQVAACVRACLQRLVHIAGQENDDEEEDEEDDVNKRVDSEQACELICQIAACITR